MKKHKTKLKGKQKMKKEATPETSDDSLEADLSDICDDIDLNFMPRPPKPL